MSRGNRPKDVDHETAVRGALEDFDNKTYDTLLQAARAHGAPISTLYHRRRGRLDRVSAHNKLQALTMPEELALCEQVRQLCEQDDPPTHATLRDMAIAVLQARLARNPGAHQGPHNPGPIVAAQLVRRNWSMKFLKRHPDTATAILEAGERRRAANAARRHAGWHNNAETLPEVPSIDGDHRSRAQPVDSAPHNTTRSKMSQIRKAMEPIEALMVRNAFLEQENKVLREANRRGLRLTAANWAMYGLASGNTTEQASQAVREVERMLHEDQGSSAATGSNSQPWM